VLKSLDWRLNLVTNRKASLSPDGRYIAYSALATNPKTRYSLSSDNDSDAQDIYVISADGMSEKVLTKTGGINDSPVWTPDGSRILFTSDRSGTFDLYSVAMRDGEAAGFPSLVKKDVGRIFPVNTMTKPGTYYYVATPQSEVHIAEMEPRALTFRGYAAGVAESFTGFRPTWSPNGQSIAFTKERAEGHRGNVDLVVQTLKTGAAKVYPSVDMNNVALGQVVSWFHDGKALLLAKNSDTGLALNRIDLNHGEIKEVAGSADFLHNGIGAISADDKTIYVRIANLKIDPNNPGRFAVDISNIDRIVPFTLIPSASVPSELSIGPDGATIRKESREAILSSSNTQRHGYSVPDGVSDLVLSPDGHTLALTSSPDPKTNEVYLACVAAADGSGYRRLYGPFRSDKLGNKIAWTADGRIILFAMSDSNDRWRIMRIPADGGSAEFTGLEVDRLRNFDLSPDGSRIAFEVGANPNWEVRALDYVSSISKTSR
jgi:Tol biopolymer transport system component